MSICRECLYCDTKERWREKVYCNWNKIYVYETESACSKMKSRNSSSDCYITTVIHDILGNPDNCEVLNNLRNFRDNILHKEEKYRDLLFEYDTIGPKIANAIENDNDKELCCLLYEEKLKPISVMIKEEKYDNAVESYKQMTNGLKVYYNIKENLEKCDDYDQLKGGHGRVYNMRKLGC